MFHVFCFGTTCLQVLYSLCTCSNLILIFTHFILSSTVLEHSHGNTCTLLRRNKASHSNGHANLSAPCHTGACLLAEITLHVSTPAPNQTPHNPEMVMPRARLYKGELASPSRYTTLFTTLLRLFSLSSNTDLIVRVLTCLQAPFVSLHKTFRRRTGSNYQSSGHSTQPLRLNRSHRTDHLTLEGGDRSLNRLGSTILHHNRFLLRASPL